MPFIDSRVQLPYRGQNGSTKEPVLLREEVPVLLERFASETTGQHTCVIQGGNRYISCYLELVLRRPVYSFKLLDVSKVRLNVVLNTLLQSDERVAKLNVSTQEAVLGALTQLSEPTRTELADILTSRGYESMDEFVKSTTTAGAINLFARSQLASPFSYPADDRKIRQEFASVSQFATEVVAGVEERFLLREILRNTEFFRLVHDDQKHIAYLDDVFYRGRTFFALLVLSLLLDVSTERWNLYTLCADRVSKNIYVDGINVLKRGVLYPFENSIRTEGGYWEEQPDCFVFRDMWEYMASLALLQKLSNPGLMRRWRSLIKNLSTSVAV
jgi:hypothetical protein